MKLGIAAVQARLHTPLCHMTPFSCISYVTHSAFFKAGLLLPTHIAILMSIQRCGSQREGSRAGDEIISLGNEWYLVLKMP